MRDSVRNAGCLNYSRVSIYVAIEFDNIPVMWKSRQGRVAAMAASCCGAMIVRGAWIADREDAQ
jgi:hypothetical protein